MRSTFSPVLLVWAPPQTQCFPLLKTNPNFVKSVLCSINSYDNFEKTYVHRITSSTQWRCNGTQISPKTQLFGPEKNFAARAPLATTNNLYYKSFTYKEKERKQERNRFHIVCLNRHLFCPKLDILTYASSCNREKLTFQLFRRFRWLMIKTSFQWFY